MPGPRPPEPSPCPATGAQPGPGPGCPWRTRPRRCRSPPPACPPGAYPLRVSTAAPVRVSLPDAGVDAPVVARGTVAGTGAFDLPADAGTVAWFRDGPPPGGAGSAVLAAHVDYGGRLGAFAGLVALEPGAEVEVGYDDGTTARFEVVDRRSYAKSSLPRRPALPPRGGAEPRPRHLWRGLRPGHPLLRGQRGGDGRPGPGLAGRPLAAPGQHAWTRRQRQRHDGGADPGLSRCRARVPDLGCRPPGRGGGPEPRRSRSSPAASVVGPVVVVVVPWVTVGMGGGRVVWAAATGSRRRVTRTEPARPTRASSAVLRAEWTRGHCR